MLEFEEIREWEWIKIRVFRVETIHTKQHSILQPYRVRGRRDFGREFSDSMEFVFWVSTFSRRFGEATYSSVETPLVVFPDTELKYMSIDKVKIYSLMCVLCYHRETPPKYRISHYFSSFTPLFILKWMMLWIDSFFYYIFSVFLFSISDNSRGRKNFKQNWSDDLKAKQRNIKVWTKKSSSERDMPP